ncbi:hypothetical protein SPFL3102_03546 [Sporomusaceae bacterium FL31]|nr:hypothetical protein SPFL3101_00459 [Sporomusaceae bacterium FL31]GCE35695.1 hypothetical protein SPFL3102_03546 [Sporomusaceae bacterium]
MINLLSVTLKRGRILFSVAIFVIMSLFFGLIGFEYMDERELAAIDNQPTTRPAGALNIVINVAKRNLEVYNDAQLYKTYRIAVGKSETPTPIGEWNVVWKDYNWGTGFGTRWMGLNVPWGVFRMDYR